jgi:uncharacterized membrane protein HdeD (DUF308 family)
MSMSTGLDRPIVTALRHEVAAIRGRWFWFVLLGIGLIALGAMALGSLVAAAIATTLVLGSFLFVGGIFEIVGSFWCRDWSGVLLELLSGILSVVVGLMLINHPASAAVAISYMLAAFLLVGGMFKAVAAFWYRLGAWGWLLLSGAIDVALGLWIWRTDPVKAMALIGTLLGVNLIFRGVAWLMIGLRLKNLPIARPTT